MYDWCSHIFSSNDFFDHIPIIIMTLLENTILTQLPNLILLNFCFQDTWHLKATSTVSALCCLRFWPAGDPSTRSGHTASKTSSHGLGRKWEIKGGCCTSLIPVSSSTTRSKACRKSPRLPTAVSAGIQKPALPWMLLSRISCRCRISMTSPTAPFALAALCDLLLKVGDRIEWNRRD